MSTTQKWAVQGTPTTVMSTELDSAASGSIKSAGSTYTNEQGTTNWDGYNYALVELILAAPGSAFAAASSFDVWIGQSGDSSPNDAPDFSFDISGLSSSYQRTIAVPLPPGVLQFFARNSQGSGSQALAASGNSLTVTPFTPQGV